MSKVEINTVAPEFTLEDYNGNSVSLSEFKEKKNVILVFNRTFA